MDNKREVGISGKDIMAQLFDRVGDEIARREAFHQRTHDEAMAMAQAASNAGMSVTQHDQNVQAIVWASVPYGAGPELGPNKQGIASSCTAALSGEMIQVFIQNAVPELLINSGVSLRERLKACWAIIFLRKKRQGG